VPVTFQILSKKIYELTEIATSSHIDVAENLEDENEERGVV